MQSFLKESLQLLHYAYFKPSALRALMSEITEVETAVTHFWAISGSVGTNLRARHFLAHCAFWWLTGLLPFWLLAVGTMPWWGVLVVSLGLCLGAWGLALSDMPLSLAFPLLAGLAWSLAPDLWPTMLTSLSSWLDWRIAIVLVASLLLGTVLRGGRAVSAVAQDRRNKSAWFISLLTFAVVAAMGVVAGITATLWAGVVVVIVGVSVVAVMAISIERNSALDTMAVTTAIVVVGIFAVVSAGVLDVNVSTGLAGGVAVGMAGGIAASVAGVMAGEHRPAIVPGVATLGVALGTVIGVAGSVAGMVMLPLIPALALVLGWGLALSPRRSLWIGLALGILSASVVTALFAKRGDWVPTVLALALFLLSYFRLVLYPLALLAIALARRRSSAPAYTLLRRLPPFSDEIVWLRLVGLDELLMAAIQEDAEQGEDAVRHVAGSFCQKWAARHAWVQLSAQAMDRIQDVSQFMAAPRAFERLPDELMSLNRVVMVREKVEAIARKARDYLDSTSDHSQLQRLNILRPEVKSFGEFLASLPGVEATHYGPIAERWKLLVDEQIAHLLRERKPDDDIYNPYTYGLPVKKEDRSPLAPRPDLVREVGSALDSPSGKPTLALYGPRRMGKTTFLLHLPHILSDEIVPVFVDLQGAVLVQSLAGLYYNWTRAAYDAAQMKNIVLPRPDLDDFVSEPSIALRNWLERAGEKLKERKLFFTFDEFEWLVDKAERDPAMIDAFSMLRHLSQHWDNVYLLFAGAHRLEELAPHGRWHDYFIHVQALEITYLHRRDAKRLITNPTENFPVNYGTGAVDEIIHLTRCHPALVQLLGASLVNWLNNPERREQGEWPKASLEDVRYAAEETLHSGRGLFANLWDDAGEDGQLLLSAMVGTEEGATSLALMQQTGLKVEQLQPALERLVQLRLSEKVEDRWRVQIELVRRAFARLSNTG